MASTKKFHLLAGLPRSGSTLLSSILQQNPRIYASQNSCLIDLLYHTNLRFHEAEQAKAFQIENQLHNALYFMAHGFYSHTNKPIIIDKSRAWPMNYDIAKVSFRNTPKVICTVRSLTDILASFITLCDKNPQNNYIDKELKKHGISPTNENRCEWLINSGGTLYECWASLKHGFENYNDHMHIIEYDELVKSPELAMNRLYRFIGEEPYIHDFDNIINHTPEDDTVYGIDGMHEVRKKVVKSPNNSLEILGETIYNKYQGGEFWR